MTAETGQPLTRILRGQPLPPGTVVAWGLKIAAALGDIHERGQLHADLKPANVRIGIDGAVELLDFGVATLSPRVGGPPGPDAREGTVFVGAPPYMSPEQVRGEPLDARSDIFSLGVLLYEMATGSRPFTGATSEEVVREILRTRPLPPSALVAELPAPLERLIMTSLAPERDDRFQTMGDVLSELQRVANALGSQTDLQRGRRASDRITQPGSLVLPRRWLIAFVAIALVAVGGFVGRGLWRSAPDPTTLLVLPLEVRGQAEGAEYLGRSFAEAMAVNLAQASETHVLPVPQADEIDGVGALAAAKTAVRFGAGRLLTGSVTRDGNSVRAAVSLVDSRENRILWGTQLDGGDGDLPAMASSLARSVAKELGATFPRQFDYIGNLTGGAAMAASPHTKGALAALRDGDILGARRSSAKLIEAFPAEVDAQALHCQALMLTWDADPTAKNRARLESAIRRLDTMSGNNPYSEVYRAYLTHRDGRSPEAVAAFTHVLRRTDLTPTMRAWTLRYRALARNPAEGKAAALSDLEQALQLDPASARTFNILSQTLLSLNRADEALVRARQAVALMPSYWRNYHALGMALSAAGRAEPALEAYATACELGAAQLPCTLHAIALLRAGRGDDARATAIRADGLTHDPDGTYNLACYWALAGDRDKAMTHLKAAIELGFVSRDVGRDPDLALIHDDPEFLAVISGIEETAGDPWPP